MLVVSFEVFETSEFEEFPLPHALKRSVTVAMTLIATKNLFFQFFLFTFVFSHSSLY